MKMNIFYKKFLLILFLIAICHQSKAQEKLTKTIEKTISMNSNGEFHIENKYGNIEIYGWDKNNIEITMTVKVYDKKEDQAVSLLEGIQPEIKIVGDIVTLTTQFTEKKLNAFTSFFNRANPLSFDKSNVEVDYTIHLPKNIAIKVVNKFGDLVIDGFYGELNADIQHGNMWLNNDIDNVTVATKFGNLKAKAILNGTIELKNAELDLKSSKNLTINSSGSTINLENISIVYVTSNKDKISINNVETLSGDFKFSTVTIETLDKQFNGTMKVTDFTIEKITNPNSSVSINQESSDITIDINSLNFSFYAYLQEGVLRIPKTFKNVKSEMIDKNQKIREINATYGKNALGNFNFKGYKGTIILKDASIKE